MVLVPFHGFRLRSMPRCVAFTPTASPCSPNGLEQPAERQLTVIAVGQRDHARLSALETDHVILRAVAVPFLEEGRAEPGLDQQAPAQAVARPRSPAGSRLERELVRPGDDDGQEASAAARSDARSLQWVLRGVEQVDPAHALALEHDHRDPLRRADVARRIAVDDAAGWRRGRRRRGRCGASARSSLAALKVAACSATAGGMPASTHSCSSRCTVGPWKTSMLPASLPVTSGTPAFQARRRLSCAIADRAVDAAGALRRSVNLPSFIAAAVPVSSFCETACCTSERRSRSVRPADRSRIAFEHRQRRIVGDAVLRHAREHRVGNRVAERSVLDAAGAGVDRVLDVARVAGMDRRRAAAAASTPRRRRGTSRDPSARTACRCGRSRAPP